MSVSTWPADSVSIIVLPSGEDGEKLFALAQRWTDADLLDRALWVKTTDVHLFKDQPLKIDALRIAKNVDSELQVEQTDLFTQLATEYFKTIRFVKVRKVSPSASDDALQDDVVDQCLEALDASLPRQLNIQNNDAALTQYHVLTLVCSTAKFSVSSEIRSARGGTTVFASPEDRTYPWSSDAFMRDGDRFTGFALMNVATIAGLWLGLPRGLVELANIDTRSAKGAWVIRTFVTGVLTDRLAKKSAAESLGRILDPSYKLSRAPEQCAFIQDRDLDAYVKALIDHLMSLDDSRLSYDRSAMEVDDKDLRARHTIVEWLGQFAKFSVLKTTQIPFWAWRFVVRIFAKKAQDKLIGSESVAVVAEFDDGKIDEFDRAILDMVKDIEKSRNDAQRVMATPVKRSQARSTPELWKEIRKSIFAAIDGGFDLQGNGFPNLNAELRPIFHSVSNAFPDPKTRWIFPEGFNMPAEIPNEVSLDNLHESATITSSLSTWVNESAIAVDELARLFVEKSENCENFKEKILEIETNLSNYDCLVITEDGESKPTTIVEATRIYRELTSEGGVPKTSRSISDKAAQGDIGTNAADDDNQIPPSDEPRRERGEENESDGVSLDADSGADVAGNAPAPVKQFPFNIGIFSRLWQKIFDVSTPTNGAQSNAHANSDIDSPEVPNLPDLIREHKQLTATLKSEHSDIATIEAQIDVVQKDRIAREDVAASFEMWRDTISRTVYAGISDRMNADREKAANDLEAVKKSLETLEVPETGAMTISRKSFHKSLVWLLVAHLGIGSFSAALLPFIAPFLIPLIFPILISTFASGILAAYLFYFRSWVGYSSEFHVLKAKFDLVDLQNRKTRDEVFRMELLHEQSLQWLRLLAQSLYHPWSIDPSWTGTISDRLDLDTIPLAMNIAQADVADGEAQARLIDAAIERLVEPGWRSMAFEDFVKIVAHSSGRGIAQFNLDALDNDLPHASNQTREILAEHQVNDGDLQRVAHERLVKIVEHLQSSTMTEIRPRVVLPNRNPLQNLKLDDDDLDEVADRDSQDWSSYLARTVCADGMMVTDSTALSPLIVSENSRLDTAFNEVRSIVVVPDYLGIAADKSRASHTTVVSNQTSKNLPVEIALRIDLVGPIETGTLAIYDGAQALGIPVLDDNSPQAKPAAEIKKPKFTRG